MNVLESKYPIYKFGIAIFVVIFSKGKFILFANPLHGFQITQKNNIFLSDIDMKNISISDEEKKVSKKFFITGW